MNKRLKKPNSAEAPKRRRHSLPSTPKTHYRAPQTPSVPTRKSRRENRKDVDWLRIIFSPHLLENTKDLAQRTRHATSLSLEEPIFVEWAQWNDSTWELATSEFQWIHLFIIAARFASLPVLEVIMSRLDLPSASKAVNCYGQNPLVALCAQPPPDVLVFEPEQYRPALLRHTSQPAAITLGGIKSTEVLESWLSFAKRRQEEMGLIAHILLKAGVDPLQPDHNGLNALDYAKRFTHYSVLSELDRSIAIGSTPSKLVDQELTQLVHSPVLSKRSVGRNPGNNETFIMSMITTVDTDISGQEVQTPRLSMSHEEDVVIQSCASNLPTACELTSQKRRGKRLVNNDNKNPYRGLNELDLLISLDN